MPHIDDHLTASDGLRLSWQAWQPEGRTEGIVCLLHGLGEHARRYEHVADVFTSSGISLQAFDLRGHGRSEGRRGHIPSYEQLLDDIDLLLDRTNSDRPIFLYGHSLGGLLVTSYALSRPDRLAGIIATGPAFQRGFEVPAIKIILGKILSGIWPTFSQHSGLNPNDLSHDPTVVQAYIDDPHVHDWVSARMFVGITRAMDEVMARAGEIQLPLLFMVGEEDRLTVPATTAHLYDLAGSTDKTLRKYPNLFHEVHNEPNKTQILDEIVDWIKARI